MQPASPSPTIYDVSRFCDGWAVLEIYNSGLSRSVVAGGFECEAAADAHIDELLAAERDEAAALAQFDSDNAAIDAELAEKLAQSASDLLFALDRGHLGNGHRFEDDSESAYVTDLRNKLAAYRAASASVSQKAA